jgi:hypothetical protein
MLARFAGKTCLSAQDLPIAVAAAARKAEKATSDMPPKAGLALEFRTLKSSALAFTTRNAFRF